MSKFQLFILIIFGFFLVGGVIVFSVYRGNSAESVDVSVWGSISQVDFENIVSNTALRDNKTVRVSYRYIPEEEFDSRFVEALAAGQGPDLFVLPSDKIMKHKNKVLVVPFSVYTERQFKDAFIEGAEVFTTPEGVLGLPVAVDPLVMYWNRSIFNDAKVTTAPKYWDEFYNLANQITKKDGALNISKSAVALGEYSNVAHAKDIVANLAMQAGTPIVSWDGSRVRSVFAEILNKPVVPAESALIYFTEFSNPAKTAYSWNRSLPNSFNHFLGGDLGIYFGFASEIRQIQLRNPNLNFDVALVPTIRSGGSNVSFGKFYGLAITKASKNPNSAFTVSTILTDREGAAKVAEALVLPPVRRDLLSVKQDRAYSSVFFDSAIRARTWLDPEPQGSSVIFKNMIESITSGRARIAEAISRASRELDDLLPQQ